MLRDLESQARLCKRYSFLLNPRAIRVTLLPYFSLSVFSLPPLDLLDQDSEMQRVMGAADSFDGASTNQGQPRGSIVLALDDIYLFFMASASLPPAPQMAVSSIAARPRSSLVRAGSLTETKLSANALRRSGGPHRNDSYDSSE